MFRWNDMLTWPPDPSEKDIAQMKRTPTAYVDDPRRHSRCERAGRDRSVPAGSNGEDPLELAITERRIDAIGGPWPGARDYPVKRFPPKEPPLRIERIPQAA